MAVDSPQHQTGRPPIRLGRGDGIRAGIQTRPAREWWKPSPRSLERHNEAADMGETLQSVSIKSHFKHLLASKRARKAKATGDRLRGAVLNF